MTDRLLSALLGQIEDLARDVGHLRRRLEPESSAAFLAERIADRVETLDATVSPSAAELRAEAFRICGNHEISTDEALRAADDRARLLRGLLRPKGCR